MLPGFNVSAATATFAVQGTVTTPSFFLSNKHATRLSSFPLIPCILRLRAQSMVDALLEAPCVALEVRSEECVVTLRELVGPMDVELAQRIRPKSIRARFGRDRVPPPSPRAPMVSDCRLLTCVCCCFLGM